MNQSLTIQESLQFVESHRILAQEEEHAALVEVIRDGQPLPVLLQPLNGRDHLDQDAHGFVLLLGAFLAARVKGQRALPAFPQDPLHLVLPLDLLEKLRAFDLLQLLLLGLLQPRLLHLLRDLLIAAFDPDPLQLRLVLDLFDPLYRPFLLGMVHLLHYILLHFRRRIQRLVPLPVIQVLSLHLDRVQVLLAGVVLRLEVLDGRVR